jgi:hypothetical protein
MKKRIILCLSGIILALACEKPKDHSSETINPVYGSWMLKGDQNSTAQLIFGKDNRYQLRFPNRSESWGGIYFLLSGNVMKIYDTFCGSKFPGVYNYVRKDNELTLSLVQDQYCSRPDFYVRTWVLTPDVSEGQISAWLAENSKVPEFDSLLSGRQIKSLVETDTLLQKQMNTVEKKQSPQ